MVGVAMALVVVGTFQSNGIFFIAADGKLCRVGRNDGASSCSMLTKGEPTN
jgi:hypothetical protein